MKKILSLLLAATLILALAACGTAGSSDSKSVSFATGGTSGTYYGFCGILGQVINEKVSDLNLKIESTGASMANVQLIEAGEAGFAIVQNDVMSYAYKGELLFEKPNQSFAGVMSCYPEAVQIVAKKDIKSVADLKGKAISVGAADSGTRFNAEQILKAYDIDFADCKINYQSFADSVDSIKNGTIDAAFIVAGAPTTAVTELATSYDFTILSIDDEHISALQKDFPFYTKISIPAGTYSCVKEDVQTVAVMATIIASNNLSEDVVYNFLKGVFDNKEEIASLHAKGELIDLNTAVSGISVPFHPGAVKFFTEMGITMPEA